MQKINSQVTDKINFYNGNDPFDLVAKYGSPLYVYNESILRARCREIMEMCRYKNYQVNYSAKANSNPALLQIVHSEGLNVDAMSPGEITAELMAGFTPSQIFYIANNVSKEEMKFAIEREILISVDSLQQLERYGKINGGGKIAIRINPGIGAGHHEKVVTAGKNTKFAVNPEQMPEALEIIKRYNLKLVGLNQHIGSLFMDGDVYVRAMESTLAFARQFDMLEFIDIGGGFGTPYRKQENEQPIDLVTIGKKLDKHFEEFARQYGKEVTFKVEPGRFIAAECGVLLGEVNAVKYNDNTKYAGTDIGFNVLMRPALYDAHHEFEIYRKSEIVSDKKEIINIVGNICETGDILAKNIRLPEIFEGDLICVLDAGAYGFVMSSNYNCRLRPAEVLIRENSDDILIRERDNIADLMKPYILLNQEF